MTVPEQATRYAALVALTDAIAAEKDRASAELRAALWQQGLTKGTVNTPLGPLTLRENKGGTSVVITDEDALIGWCEEFSPESIERIVRVRPNDRAVLLSKRFVPVAGQVVDSVFGVVVEFAKVEVTEPSAPTPSYGQTQQKVDTKRLAAQYVGERAAQLTEHLAASVLALDPPEFDGQAGE